MQLGASQVPQSLATDSSPTEASSICAARPGKQPSRAATNLPTNWLQSTRQQRVTFHSSHIWLPYFLQAVAAKLQQAVALLCFLVCCSLACLAVPDWVNSLTN
jgi:hypothetical protein